MKKFKNWLINRFLPMWAKESVLKELKSTREENEVLRQKITELEAYIKGMHTGMKNQRRIVINTGEVKK
jgi:cell division protein FtsB